MFGRMRIRRRGVVGFVAVTALFLGATAGAGEGLGRLAATALPLWRFRAGDDVRWSARDVDDSGWREVRAPSLRRLPWLQPRGWFRCTFGREAAARYADPGLWLGRVDSADEVYLNGVRIGGEGRIDSAFVEAPRKFRLYALPVSLLQDRNVLAVRVQNSFPWGGLVDCPRLVSLAAVWQERQETEQRIKLVEAVAFGILLSAVVFWVILLGIGAQSGGVRQLGLLTLLLAAIFVCESLFLYDAGGDTAGVTRLCVVLFLLLPIPVLGFLHELDPDPWGARRSREVGVVLLVFAVAYLAFGSLSLCMILYLPYALLVLATIGLLLRAGLKPVVRQAPEYRAFLFGLGLLFLSLAFDFLLEMMGSVWSRVPSHVGSVLFVLAIVWGLALRFSHTHRALRQLSQRTLAKQEEERKRIAYELHDGFGQILLALRLNVQLLRNATGDRAPAERELLDRLVEETGTGCDQLHRMIRGLRPASLSELGFAAALRELAGREALAPDVEFRLTVEDGVELSEAVESALYRVAQEAVANALKHARPTTIAIRFAEHDGTVQLEVADDGCGLAPKPSRQGEKGIGLLAMRERMAGVGGRLVIEGNASGGTTVRAEVKAS
jgi:signal transduction histidine kinase